MSTRIRNTDLRDPLEAYSGLTLFPRTLASIPLASKPSDPSDPHAVHDFLKSMPLEGSDELIEQAKAIVDSCSGVSNSMPASLLNSKDENETLAAKVIANPQERRPALGRKRARFSLKPNSSQPTVSLEPILDMDKLKDPEEFFLAFEKLENAKRELQKQTGGVSMDLNQPNPSLASRPRRPGLLGRSVKYKHHYSNDICSKGNFKENILSSTDLGVQKETTNSNVAFEERESDDDDGLQEMKADSVAKAENKVNELLGELLANHPEELDGDGTVTLLQERLRIKPIDIEKLCIPDLQDVRRLDLKAAGPNFPKPRSTLSDIQNVVKGISSKTPKTHRKAESTVACLASPTPPRSPLDSIISLKKRIQQSKSITDPFSALNIDKTPARSDFPVGSIKEQTAQGNTVKETEENNIADMNLSVPEVADKSVDDNMSIPGSGIYVNPSGSNAYVNDNDGGSCVDSRVVNETSGSPDTDADIWTNEVNEFDHKMEDTLTEAEDSERGRNTQAVNEPNGLDDKMEDTLKEVEDSVEPGPNTEASNESNGLDDKMGDTSKETVESVQPVENRNARSLLDEADPAVVEEHVVDAPPKIADTGPKHHNEEAQISTKNPLNEESKTIAPHKKRKRKEVSRRQSLAAFGTSWQDGIRRSTRIRSRPLEYWRGERFLYGRVNQSVVSVIGIKYESPAKGKPVLKVKSFVSDEFKQQVEDAAKF